MVDIKFKLQRSSLTCCGVQLFSDSRGLTWKTARWTGCLRCNVGRACTGTRQALQDTDGSRNGYFRRVWQRGISVVGIVVVSFVVLSRSHLSEESGGLVLFWFAKCACQILAKFCHHFPKWFNAGYRIAVGPTEVLPTVLGNRHYDRVSCLLATVLRRRLGVPIWKK